MSQTESPEMTAELRASHRRQNIGLAIAAGVLALVALVWFVVAQALGSNADAERSDGYYCVQEGVTLSDRGPQTGELCADILKD